MTDAVDAPAAIRRAADGFRAAAISASHAVAGSPYAVDPDGAADIFHIELEAVADALNALADALASADAAAPLAGPLAVALDTLASGLPYIADSDPDTSRAVDSASASAFLALADALDGLPATLDDLSDDYRPLVTYQAAKARADARIVAHAFGDLLAAHHDVDEVVDLDEAAYEIYSDREAATRFVVCDTAAALASAHARRKGGEAR